MVEIRLSGPGKNALGVALMADLTRQIQAAAGQPLLVTGEGDAFSAGLNLAEVLAADTEAMLGFLHALEGLLRALYLHDGPTAAAVNGHAIAGGCLVAMCCDVRVATDHPRARIGLNEVALGLRFPPALLRLVQARISPAHLDEVVLGGALHDPAGALRLGFVDELSGDPVARARERLGALAAHPREAYAATKRDLRSYEPTAAEERRFVDEVLPVWTSAAIKDRIRGFLTRR